MNKKKLCLLFLLSLSITSSFLSGMHRVGAESLGGGDEFLKVVKRVQGGFIAG